ncbi:MAG: acyltransferase [Oscillospiraceae bacterium]|nr:acyltransferase [Oscillospiraceae bacterium]
MEKQSRNYGVDLLRIVSMFMVIVLHVLGSGGLLDAPSALRSATAWFMEISAYSAVNIYGLISGYVGYSEHEKERPYRNALSFWVTVAFWSAAVTLFFSILHPELFSRERITDSFFPISRNVYWYASAYFPLLFVAPLLNRLVRNSTDRQNALMVALLVIIFSVFATYSARYSDPFTMHNGYSFLWLLILYLIGAWAKKSGIASRVKLTALFIASAICIVITWAWHTFIPGYYPNTLVNYLSPTVLIPGFTLLCAFARLRINGAALKLTKIFSPAAFGVYLIHIHPLSWQYSFAGRFHVIGERRTLLLPISVIGSAFVILICCLILEKLRLLLFEFLGINKLIRKISDFFYFKVVKTVLSRFDLVER